MTEFVKVTCVVVLMFVGTAATVAWFDDRPSEITWLLRVGGGVLTIAALGVFLVLHFRRDFASDYLHEMRHALGPYFNRGGFCFALRAEKHDGICWLVLYFQNQYDRPCAGRIALRPFGELFGLLRSRGEVDHYRFEIPCAPAAFGYAALPVPVDRSAQGNRWKFEVGASVEYPEGRGTRLRNRDGVVLRSNENFENAFARGLRIAGLFSGTLVINTPASAIISLPFDVAEELPPDRKSKIETLWKLDDPPLSAHGWLGMPGASNG